MNLLRPETAKLIETCTFRPLTQDDRVLIDAFFDQMGGESRAFFNRGDGNRKTAHDYIEGRRPDSEYYVLEKDNKVIGLVFLWEVDKGVPTLGIAVHEAYKGLGLGRFLITRMIDRAKALNRGGIQLTTGIANIRGQSLYSRMGFEFLGTHKTGEFMYLLQL